MGDILTPEEQEAVCYLVALSQVGPTAPPAVFEARFRALLAEARAQA